MVPMDEIGHGLVDAYVPEGTAKDIAHIGIDVADTAMNVYFIGKAGADLGRVVLNSKGKAGDFVRGFESKLGKRFDQFKQFEVVQFFRELHQVQPERGSWQVFGGKGKEPKAPSKEPIKSLTLRPHSTRVSINKYNRNKIAETAKWRGKQLDKHAWNRHPGLAKDRSNQLPQAQLYDQGARQTIRDADIVIERTNGDVLFINSKTGFATSARQEVGDSWRMNSYRIQTLDP